LETLKLPDVFVCFLLAEAEGFLLAIKLPDVLACFLLAEAECFLLAIKA